MKIIECPRDAMQGIHTHIPTRQKIAYINALLRVGFDTIDFGSFVSPKVIPQMEDTRRVVRQLDLSDTDTQLLAIVANERGAVEASGFEQIHYLGFPFSVSETFQRRNTNITQEQAFGLVQDIYNLCLQKDKELVVYLSMGFGNPYGDVWDPAIVEHWTDRLVSAGIGIISVADTVGIAQPKQIGDVFADLTSAFPDIEFGAHLHSEPHNWQPKLEAAYQNGCHRFDGAMRGYGGCPMAQNTLVGNMATENIVRFFEEERADFVIDHAALAEAQLLANEVFGLVLA
ncbi:MAG: hydroxymethylglutaryl-CoA lyase [Sphingobacteriales bacterium]|nr:hydroxymethylglutaryl-CoA lyase [Sphingobacteriales bacterium]MCC7223791.1 hydroxymethylglutaryl-CoA lyase [Chitinophagales bacterium]